MSVTASKIKQIEGLMAHGATLSEAIAKALGFSLSDLARRMDVQRERVSMCLNGYPGREYPEIRDAICTELEIPREYLDRLIDDNRKQSVA